MFQHVVTINKCTGYKIFILRHCIEREKHPKAGNCEHLELHKSNICMSTYFTQLLRVAGEADIVRYFVLLFFHCNEYVTREILVL